MLNLKISDMQMTTDKPKEEGKNKAIKSIFSNIGGFPGMNCLQSQDSGIPMKVDWLLSKPTAWFASRIKVSFTNSKIMNVSYF